MPTKGHRQTPAHKHRISAALKKYRLHVARALETYVTPRNVKIKGSKPPGKPDPVPTPIPPSASRITHDLPQRWAIYSFNADGQYYFKREQADTLHTLQKLIRQLDLPLPLWTFVKSGRTQEELGIMPIRIPHSALPALGQRFHAYRKPKS